MVKTLIFIALISLVSCKNLYRLNVTTSNFAVSGISGGRFYGRSIWNSIFISNNRCCKVFDICLINMIIVLLAALIIVALII